MKWINFDFLCFALLEEKSITLNQMSLFFDDIRENVFSDARLYYEYKIFALCWNIYN